MIDLPLPPSTHSKDKAASAAWAVQVQMCLEGLQRPPGTIFEVVLDFYGPWFKDNGELDPKMPDIDRMIHKLLDMIAKQCRYNDRANHRVVMNKISSSYSRCTVWLRPCPLIHPGF